MHISLYVIALLASVLLAAAAILAHAAIERIDRVKAHQLVQDERKGGEALLRIVENPAMPVTILHLLAVVAQVAVVVLLVGGAISSWGLATEAVVVAALAALLLTVLELAVRSMAVVRTEAAALWGARLSSSVEKILFPVARALVWITNLVLYPFRGPRLPKGPFVTAEEIRAIVDPVEDDEEIEEDEEDERELIHSVFEFGDTIVREVMVPRPDMISMRSDASLQEALEVIIDAGYSRIPIYANDVDNIVGVLYAKDLMRRMHEEDVSIRTVGSLGRAPTFVPETKKLTELLREMQEQHVHMGIVVDEYGGTAGLVTIEDLIEEIVGEIVDEFDREEPLVEPIDDESMRVDAKMPIDEVNELLGSELPHEEWDTVGGLVFALTGRVPAPGETVRFDGLLFTTERVTGRRIQKVVIRRTEDLGEP